MPSFGFLKRYTKHEDVLLYLAVAYLVAFEVIIQYVLPSPLNEQVIIPVTTLIATIEGIIIALSPQIRIRTIRNWVAVGIGIPALMFSLITVTIAYYQSIQLGYRSQDWETFLFRTDAFFFIILVELYAVGILFSKSKDDQEPKL